jgi:hypothetical protein
MHDSFFPTEPRPARDTGPREECSRGPIFSTSVWGLLESATSIPLHSIRQPTRGPPVSIFKVVRLVFK